MSHIFVVGTADTKGEELAYLAARVRAAGGDALVVDVGTAPLRFRRRHFRTPNCRGAPAGRERGSRWR